MKEFTVCEVLNNDDKKPMTIHAQWLEDEIKIVIMRAGIVPRSGQTTITKLCESNPGKTREEAVEIIKNELTGRVKDIQFSLNDTRLRWKKKIWNRGTIDVQRVEDIVFLGNLCFEWAKQCESLQDNWKKLQKSNETLEKKTQQLVNQMVEMERVKNDMEKTLYKQFLLILNTKKRKIRELEEKLKNRNKNLELSVYDKSTDESDAELEETTKKRKKTKSQRESSPVASTSKRFSKSPLKPDAESDEEIVLRYDESQQQPLNNLNLTEEDPEDDLFSQ